MASEQKTRTRGKPQKVTGFVVSSGRNKTIKVRTESMTRHPVYGKYVRHQTICHAHDEGNEAGPGDLVELMECRPISKTKHWRLVRIVEKSRTGEATTSARAEG